MGPLFQNGQNNCFLNTKYCHEQSYCFLDIPKLATTHRTLCEVVVWPADHGADDIVQPLPLWYNQPCFTARHFCYASFLGGRSTNCSSFLFRRESRRNYVYVYLCVSRENYYLFIISCIIVVGQDKEKVCTSQLSLVDLAGSERPKRTGTADDRLREAGDWWTPCLCFCCHGNISREWLRSTNRKRILKTKTISQKVWI